MWSLMSNENGVEKSGKSRPVPKSLIKADILQLRRKRDAQKPVVSSLPTRNDPTIPHLVSTSSL